MEKLKPIVKRTYVPLMTDLFLSSYADTENYQKLYSVDFYMRCGYVTGAFYYWPEAEKFGDVLMEEDKKRENYLEDVFKTIYQKGESLLKQSTNLSNREYDNSSKEELVNLFKDFVEEYQVFALSLAGFYLQLPIEKRLREIVSKTEDPEENLAILSFPKKHNFAALEQHDLYILGEKIKGGISKSYKDLPDDFKQDLIDHSTKYGWINTRGGIEDPWAPEDIFQRIVDMKDIDFKIKTSEFESDQEKHQESSSQLVNNLALDEKERRIVEIAKELVYFRTYRTDYLNMTFSMIRPLMEAIAEEKGLGYRDLIYMRIEEIIEGHDVSKDEVNQRKHDYVLATLEPHSTYFSSDLADISSFKDKYVEEEVLDEISFIKGSAAFKGSAKGTVKVVKTKADFSNVEVNDVLVAPMTTPDMVPIMQKAAAFVTDEGGITCHAAIVAREMKKPCVIGTGNATSVLKDGDEVEVGVEDGLVKITKRAS